MRWHDDVNKSIYDDLYEDFHHGFTVFTRVITDFTNFTCVIR